MLVQNIISEKQKKAIYPYMLLSPALILIFGLLFMPVIRVFFESMTSHNLNKPYLDGFIGFGNFKTILFQDKLFWKSLGISFKWVAVQVPAQLIVGMALAIILNQRFRFRGLFRATAFVPWAVSGVLTAVVWSMIFNEHMGVLNDILMRIGILDAPRAWVASAKMGFISTAIAELWRGIPFFAIMLLAALQTIPGEVYEAAKVDGSNAIQTFAYITIPYIKETIILSTLLRTVWEFKMVDVIYNLTGGGPANKTTTLMMYMVDKAIKAGDFGYGSALAVITFIILMVFAAFYLKLSGFGKEDA